MTQDQFTGEQNIRDRFLSETYQPINEQTNLTHESLISEAQYISSGKLQKRLSESQASTAMSSNANTPIYNQDNISVQSFKTKYKTEMCRNWELWGDCKFGDTCAFAHGDDELQKKKHVPSKYKTKLCKQYHENLYCPYGLRCQFAHSIRQFDQGEGKTLSYQQMLDENINQIATRLKNSQNPDVIEFSTVGKTRCRLKVFESITRSKKIQGMSNEKNDENAENESKKCKAQKKHNQKSKNISKQLQQCKRDKNKNRKQDGITELNRVSIRQVKQMSEEDLFYSLNDLSLNQYKPEYFPLQDRSTTKSCNCPYYIDGDFIHFSQSLNECSCIELYNNCDQNRKMREMFPKHRKLIFKTFSIQ